MAMNRVNYMQEVESLFFKSGIRNTTHISIVIESTPWFCPKSN